MAEMKSYTMGTIAEKVPCELKDHRQQGLIKQRHMHFDKRFREINDHFPF